MFNVSRDGGGRISCSTDNRVIEIYDRSQAGPIPDGARLLDDFLDEFEALPEVAEHLPAARRALAEEWLLGRQATLRDLRLMCGLSQSEFGERIGSSQAAVSAYEKRQQKPGEEMLRRMSAALSVDFNTLMDALANG
jgi:DNA-binding XRE family transcriptional regulator